MGTDPRPDNVLLNVSSIHLINNTVHMLPQGTTTTPEGPEGHDNSPDMKIIHVKPRISERMDRAKKGISTNVFQTSYDPMTGVRTGCILGGFLLLIVAYVIYKGKCKDQDDSTGPEEPWVTEYKKKYEEYMKKIEERKLQEKGKNLKKSERPDKIKVIVEPAPKQEANSAAIEKTKKWLQDQPFDLEKLECTECKMHAKINQFQALPHHSLSFEDLHQCGSDREDDIDYKAQTKGGYLAINDISLLRKRPSNLEGIDFFNLLREDSNEQAEGNLVGLHSEPKAADDDTHTTVDIEMTDLSTDGDNEGYISLSNEHDAVTSSIVTPSMTSQQEELAEQDPDDSMPLLRQTSSPAKSISSERFQKPPSEECLSLLDSMHIIPEYPDKPRYSDGVLEFGRLFMNKPNPDNVPEPRKLLDIRDNSKFSLYKSSPDSITCDPLTLTFPALPFDDSFTSSSGDPAESPTSSEKPPSVLSASSVTIYVTPMSSPNYDASQNLSNQGVFLDFEADSKAEHT